MRKHPSDEDQFVHWLVSYDPWRGKVGSVKGVLTTCAGRPGGGVRAQLLEESQHRLISVLHNLFSFVAVLELDGTLIEANIAPREAAGLGIDDVRGQKVWETYWWSHDAGARAAQRCS